MTNIFIIHGTCGKPNENWFPWLKSKLEKLGHNVFAPQFPTPENHSRENWLKTFEEYQQHVDKDSIFIGHSAGPAFIISLLEEINKPIKAAFLVAPFIRKLGIEKYDDLNISFFKEYNWDKIKQNCKKFFVYSSDNDPYVPIDIVQEVASGLDVNVITIKGAGHFNESAGYKEFPQLLENVKKFI